MEVTDHCLLNYIIAYIPIPLDEALPALMAIMVLLQNTQNRSRFVDIFQTCDLCASSCFQYTPSTILLRSPRRSYASATPEA